MKSSEFAIAFMLLSFEIPSDQCFQDYVVEHLTNVVNVHFLHGGWGWSGRRAAVAVVGFADLV